MEHLIQRLQNILVNKPDKNNFLLDIHYRPNQEKKDIVIFCHGFKGFKDWGAWNLIAEHFAAENFVFVKFNFSHNGTGIEDPVSFTNLDAFAQNNYSKEWADLQACIQALKTIPDISQKELNHNRIHLIGHSRGGGLVLTMGHNIPEVQSISGWASVDALDYAWKDPSFIETWKKKGYYEVYNGRTKQYMQLNYQFYEDYSTQVQKFQLSSNIAKFKGPVLLCHGANDKAIPPIAADNIKSYKPNNTEICILENCDHVFNMMHPFGEQQLGPIASKLVRRTIHFIKNG